MHASNWGFGALALGLLAAGCSGGGGEDVSSGGINESDSSMSVSSAPPAPSTAAEDAAVVVDAFVPAPEDAALEEDAQQPSRCGDGTLDEGEACDTGALSDLLSDACRGDCTLARCGDGVVDTGERCDDGDARSDSVPGACRTSCERAGCGDGVPDPGEACDTGAALSNSAADACRLDCSLARCGDDVVDDGEACDTGLVLSDLEPNACRTSCTRASCGDGVLDNGEGCDTGRAQLSDSAPNACRASCTSPRCGDGVTDSGESCDDADNDDGNGCRNDCSLASCGDGRLDANEQCDDGNRDNADGCQASCLLPVCGDGVVDSGEACDDDNTFENDGCRSNCQLGCTTTAECSDAQFCNGPEQCVAGICQPGTPPVIADTLGCTEDRCDEDTDRIVHAPSDGLCSATPNSCNAGALTQYAAGCGADGCSETPRTTACPDQASSCSAGPGRDMLLTTFTPACAGSACGAPAATTQSCLAPAASCDAATRVGTVYRATCDATRESCGTEVQARNDCAALDSKSCSADASAHLVSTGRCAAGECDVEMTRTACAGGGTQCSDGATVTLTPSCDPARGCGTPTTSARNSCPALPNACAPTSTGYTFTTYTPACADGSNCDASGRANTQVCPSGGTVCSAGVLRFTSANCDPIEGCGIGTMSPSTSCGASSPACSLSGNVLSFTTYVAACQDAQSCLYGGQPTTQTCGAPVATSCRDNRELSSGATCDEKGGCNRVSDSRACTASEPTCTRDPTAKARFTHTRYTASCDALGGRCIEGGAKVETTCESGLVRCAADGSAATEVSSAVCDPRKGCVTSWVSQGACPAVQSGCNGSVYEVRVPACEAGACTYRVTATRSCLR